VNTWVRRVAYCAAISILAIRVLAQSNGSILGTVKDPNGAVVPSADITITSEAQGLKQMAATNDLGRFVFAQLPPGVYTLAVEAAGFKKKESSNIVLSVASTVNVGDVVLELGSIREVVTVEADAGTIQIQSESGERSNIVTNRQLRDIGLNGRNVVDLMRTIPGVISGGVTANAASTVTNIAGGFNINGTRAAQHEYTIDGVTNLNLGNNTGALVSVNPDALQEVKVLTSNYQAEYGRAGGGFIALTTRGGTNEVHGGARYFRRHDSLNANPYFNNLRGGSAAGFPRPLYRYNFYGWDFGGPVYIPRVVNGRNKLFFFISQEYYRQLVPQAASMNIRVPTEAERSGDFSRSVDGAGRAVTVRDPATGMPFPGNVVPANRIYMPGKSVLNFLPVPNTAAGGNVYNYTSQVPSSYPRSETILRGDWHINDSTRLSARWVYNLDAQRFAYGTTTASWNWPLTITERRNGPGSVPTISMTKNFGPTWVGEFMFGVGRGGVTIAPQDDRATRTATGVDTPLLYPDANTANLIPSLLFGGIGSIPVVNNVPAVANTAVFGTFDQRFLIWQTTDTLTKVSGKHVFKIGFYFQSASNASNSQNRVQSDIDFSANASNPLDTGYPFSNALLGVYNTYTQASTKINQNNLYHDLSWFAQDTWKITPRLSLDLGVRFSWYQPLYNSIGDGSFFDPALFDASNAQRIYRPVCVGAVTCASGAATYRAIDPATTGTPTMDNTFPSYFAGKLIPNTGKENNGLGLASQGYPKGGIDAPLVLTQPRLGFAWDVTGSHKTVVRGGFGITYDRYQSDITGNAPSNPPFVLNPTLQFGYLQDIRPGATTALSPSAIRAVERKSDFPTIYSYSVGVQRNVGAGTVLDASYVGSMSRKLARRTNLNTPAYGLAFAAAAQDPTKFANGVIPAVEPGLPAIYSAAGLAFSGANILPTDFLRPYQGYSDITTTVFDADADYHSLQISATRRFSKGLTFGVAYTLSKVETTVSDDQTYTRLAGADQDYALAAFDRTHYFVSTAVWDLPRFSGMIGGGKLGRAILDNWTLSGLTTIASGNTAELTLTIAGVDAGTRLLGTPTAGNLSGQQPRFLLNGNPETDGRINPEAFQVPGIGNAGPYPRQYLRNPGIRNQDLSIFKNVPLGGDGKRYLQLRMEAFNILNHVQFSNQNRTANVTNGAGQTGGAILNNFTDLRVTNNLRPSGSTAVLGTYFGEYNAARDMRIIQLAVKFYF
jgi:outer membrane receptor protein involved in Fe transport